MKNVWTVFCFTLRDGFRKKAFLLTTIIVSAIILFVCMLPGLINGSEEEPGNTEVSGGVYYSGTCYIADDAGLLPNAERVLRASFSGITVEKIESGQIADYKEKLLEEGGSIVLSVTEKDGMPFISFYEKSFMSGVPTDEIVRVLSKSYVAGILAESGVEAGLIESAVSDLQYTLETVSESDFAGYTLGIVITMIIFFAVYFYGYGVSMSIATEKASRVMETLIVSTKPASVLLGKCLGMGLLGLCQLAVFLLVGSFGYKFLLPENFTIMGMPLEFTNFTPGVALLILCYFLLGYALYALMNSVCGAMVNRIEDLNSAMMPVVLVSMISFYCSYITVIADSPSMKRLVSLIPFTSPFALPFRLLNETVPAGELVLSLALLVVTGVLVAFISVKLYSASVLHYGSRLKFKDLKKL